MRSIIEKLDHVSVSRQRVELVERKGKGHPDSICDAAMEYASQALCLAYLQKFGHILHHNLDKGLLVAGRSESRLGGGKILEPMKFIIGDRATSEYHGQHINVHRIVEDSIREWIGDNLPRIDTSRHIVFQSELKRSSEELGDIFDRQTLVANDTSAAVGYAPLSETENLVLIAENFLNSVKFKQAFPEAGEDVKVMGYRRDRTLDLTIAIAFVDREIANAHAYFSRKQEMRESLEIFLKPYQRTVEVIQIEINALDDPERGMAGMYLTVLGTSAEAGDCGAVGRGNKVNGVISMNRPSSMEAAAGKNAVSHVGKIYSILSHSIAEEIHNTVEGLDEVYVWLGSKIGSPISEPAMASVQLVLSSDIALQDVEKTVRDIFDKRISDVDHFVGRMLKGEFPVC